MIDEGLIPEAKKREAITDALKHFYYAITVSNRVDKHLLQRAVMNVADIYEKYYDKNAQNIAMNKLRHMFPKLLAGTAKPTISIVVDVSPV